MGKLSGNGKDGEKITMDLAGVRFFEHYPETPVCPICQTADDRICILAGLDGTGDGSIEQAIPVHLDCLMKQRFRHNSEHGIFYCFKP